MTDRVQRRTRGLMAIAISDAIEARGLQPIAPVLVGLRSFFRIEMPSSAGELVTQAAMARRSTTTLIGCVGLFGIAILPILLPIELVHGARVRRHTEAMMRRLPGAPSLPSPGGYRDNAAEPGDLREGLAGADSLLAIDWTIWRDGTACFAGTALGVVRGEQHAVPWFTVFRGPPPKGALDAAGLARALPDLPLVTTRWEWELHDPFEATEREGA